MRKCRAAGESKCTRKDLTAALSKQNEVLLKEISPNTGFKEIGRKRKREFRFKGSYNKMRVRRSKRKIGNPQMGKSIGYRTAGQQMGRKKLQGKLSPLGWRKNEPPQDVRERSHSLAQGERGRKSHNRGGGRARPGDSVPTVRRNNR